MSLLLPTLIKPVRVYRPFLGSSLACFSKPVIRAPISRAFTRSTVPTNTFRQPLKLTPKRLFGNYPGYLPYGIKTALSPAGLKALALCVGLSALSFYGFPILFLSPGFSQLARNPTYVVYGLAALNAAVFLAWRAPQYSHILYRYFVLHGINLGLFNKFQLLGSAFSHMSFTHIALNMLGAISFGNALAATLGPANFLTLYLSSALFSSWFSAVFQASSSLGASGAVFGLLACFSYIFPHASVLMFFIPGDAWYMFLLSVGVNMAGVFFRWGHLDYIGHLGGSLAGVVWGYFVVKYQKARRQRSRRFW